MDEEIRKKKYSHHDTIHFIDLIFDVIKRKRPFNSELYRKLLKKYKYRDPEKFMELLENEPLLPG
jgi:hypothetical protein